MVCVAKKKGARDKKVKGTWEEKIDTACRRMSLIRRSAFISRDLQVEAAATRHRLYLKITAARSGLLKAAETVSVKPPHAEEIFNYDF